MRALTFNQALAESVVRKTKVLFEDMSRIPDDASDSDWDNWIAATHALELALHCLRPMMAPKSEESAS